MSDFFITAPSNSNYDLFPNNTVTDYTVNFNRPLPIDETFEIALVECHFPYDVDSRVKSLKTEDTIGLLREFHLPEGRVELSIVKLPIISAKWNEKQDLVEEINHIVQSYLESVNFIGNIPHYKYVHGALQKLDIQDVNITLTRPLERKLHSKDIDYVYVYTDIIEPTFVGDGQAKLLRIVDVSCSKGKVCSVIYENPQYYRVISKEPQTITINLRSSLGDFIPLRTLGTTNIVLHARKRL